MSYTINLTNGTIFAVVADGTINTSSSMTLIGQNYAGYGAFLDTNFIHALENSSNTTPPSAPLTGQLWWDSGNSLLKVYNGSSFKTISSTTAQSTAPSNNVTGDLWYNTSTQQLNVWTGTAWLVVGPGSNTPGGTTGAVPTAIIDNVSVTHYVIELYSAGTIVAMISKDPMFTPGTPIAGFAAVYPGITLSTVGGAVLTGTATNASALNSLTSSQFMRTDANTSTTGTLSVLNNTGLSVGASSDFRASVSGTAVTLSNQTQNGNIGINVNIGGTPTTAIAINGSTGQVTIPSLVPPTNVNYGNITVNNILNGLGAGLGNIGNATAGFNTVFAQSTSAQYADLAERFEIDTPCAPGTVVELGGSAEITQVNDDLSDNVFGVISTQAAYLMNSKAGSDTTHPPVAMTGRVPVRTIGPVHKGDRLVSAGNGLARSALPGEATAFNVIGRALKDKLGSDEGTVEAIVTIN